MAARTVTDTATRDKKSAKRERGRRSFLNGQSAEGLVAKAYLAAGSVLLETRWRGKAGEIDLIFLERGTYVFCEVKAAHTHEAAMQRLLPGQMQRIYMAASEYLSKTPDGQLSDVRFDLASVDAKGEVGIVQNAFGHF